MISASRLPQCEEEKSRGTLLRQCVRVEHGAFFVKLCQKVHGVDFLQERRSRLSGDQFSPLKRSSPSSGSKVVMTPWFFTKCSVSV